MCHPTSTRPDLTLHPDGHVADGDVAGGVGGRVADAGGAEGESAELVGPAHPQLVAGVVGEDRLVPLHVGGGGGGRGGRVNQEDGRRLAELHRGRMGVCFLEHL